MSISDISSNGSFVIGDKDVSISDISSHESGEIEDSSDYNNWTDREFYFDELEKQPLQPSQNNEEFVTDVDIKNVKGGIDFCYIHDQDMSYYREIDNYYLGRRQHNDETFENFNNETMLGRIDVPRKHNVPNTSTKSDEYDPQFDEEVNKILDELAEDLEEPDTKVEDTKKEDLGIIDVEREKYEDYYDEFPEDEEDDKIYEWYELMCQKKLKETKRRLGDLSSLVCYASASTREQIIRIEQDHNTPFCKLDFPRHPPLHKPWINYWRFNCPLRCGFEDKVSSDELHVHTPDCEFILLEHVNTETSTRSKNVIPCEFPDFVMVAVARFQEFINKSRKEDEYLDKNCVSDTVYEKPTWSYIKLRSNYKNELMLIACGKGITPLLMPLRRYFQHGPGRSTNVVSVYCVNIRWSQKKGQFHPTHLTGLLELRDKVGPISLNYSAKTNVNFNSVEAQQLGKLMLEYLSPTSETSLIDIGCNIGALSLMLTQKCEKVIGFNTLEHEVKLAEEIKLCNRLHNASFFVCHPKDIQSKCAPLVKKCITVAILNLGTQYGKSPDVMKALRNLPSIWRVVLYGSFTKDYHRNITLLTSKDEQLGDEFLPMQGCMLDTFPTVENAFDIVILFERKSLIEPSIELIGVGPTVNIRTDTNGIPWRCKDEVKLNTEFTGKTENKYDNKDSVKIENPFPKYNRPSLRYGKFDSPLITLKKEPDSNEKSKPVEILPPVVHTIPKTNPKPVNTIKILRKIYDCPSLPIKQNDDRLNDSQPLSLNNESKYTDNSLEKSSHTQMLTKSEVSNSNPISILNDIKRLRKIYDCPPLPNGNKDGSSNNSNLEQAKKEFQPSTQNGVENQLENYLPNKFNFPPPPIPNQNQYANQPSVNQQEDFPVIKTEIKQEPNCNFYFAPMPKVEHMESDTEEGELIESGVEQAQKEDKIFSDANIKPEPMDLDDDEDQQTLIENIPIPPTPYKNVSTDNTLTSSTLDTTVKVKSEPIDNGYENVPYDPTIRIKSEPIEPVIVKKEPVEPVIVKKEPVEPVIVKTEPIVSNTLPSIDNLDDFINMPTPIHNPAALANRNRPISPVKPTNFVIDGHQFSVQPNQSYLQTNLKAEIKPDPDDPQQQPEQLQEPLSAVAAKEELLEPGELPNTDVDNGQIQNNGTDDDEITVISVKKKIKIERQGCRDSLEDERRQRALPDNMHMHELEEKRKQLQMELERDNELRQPNYYCNSQSTKRTRSPQSPTPRWMRPISTGWRPRSPVSPTSISNRLPDAPIADFKRAKSPASPYSRERSSSSFRRQRSPDSPASYKRSKSPFDQKSRYKRTPPAQYRSRSPTSPVRKRARSPIIIEYDRSKSPFDQKKHRYKKSSKSSSKSDSKSSSKSKHKRYSPTPPLRSKYSWAESSSMTSRKNSQSDSRSSSPTVNWGYTKKSNKAPENVQSTSYVDDQWDIPALSSLEGSLSIPIKATRENEDKKGKQENTSSSSPTSN